MRFPKVVLLSACVLLLLAAPLLAQSPNGVLNGLVVDPTNRAIVGADVIAVNDVTGIQHATKTNDGGIYVLPNLPPGPYRLQVSKVGFKTLIKPDITLNVQDALAINFTLPIGALSETVTVEGGAPLVNTESAAVSTVVDRNFAENLPMNGRSFQTLIQLTPGVVMVPSNVSDGGQFSVNGQRSNSNYWLLDGVGANIGVNANFQAGTGMAGSLGGFSAMGGTNSLVSVDAMQEFRIQTSTYAPEFGRTPGAQISIATRSGTNQFHGTAFDYLRNDIFDANDWFANKSDIPKPEERQNDFGGTFNGPIVKDRSFFFFSYEGLRLRLPQVALDTVPSLAARQAAIPAVQPFLNAFPKPNGADLGNGLAQFNASFSNSSSLDAYSLRVDHRLNDSLTLFGRYNYSPSNLVLRGAGANGSPKNDVSPVDIKVQTATVGGTWLISPRITNDLRFNYSRTASSSRVFMDDFGGAVPLATVPFPSPFTTKDSFFAFNIISSSAGALTLGNIEGTLHRQINVVNNLSIQAGSHSIKLGVDFRRLSPFVDAELYSQQAIFLNVADAENGTLFFGLTRSGRKGTLRFRNLGMFAQDTWKALPRLTLTYGLRWDVDFSPSATPNLLAVTGFNLNDLSNLNLAPDGTPLFRTRYGNVAPRFGLAYQVSQSPRWQSVLRGGFGVFYDLATQEVGNHVTSGSYPFGATNLLFDGTFPLDPQTAAPPPINQDALHSTFSPVPAFDPNLNLPYTLEWNLALEQAIGGQQSLSLSYIGASGRRLIQSASVSDPNPNFAAASLIANAGTSNYNALQVQFQRRLSGGLQALASYNWSHSIDTASSTSAFNDSNALVPGIDPNTNRGPSDFDIRNAFSAGITYAMPSWKGNRTAAMVLGGWSLQTILQVHSAPPVTVFDSNFSSLFGGAAQVRPDLAPGIPLYLYGSQYPGGKSLNNTPDQGGPGCVGPFCPPPTDSNGDPLRQGTLGRNALRGFGSFQWDFAVHRTFSIHDSLKLQFRSEMFNVLNHPNFGPPIADISDEQFGQSTQMLGQSLNGGFGGNLGGGGLSPLYQIGGPRSIQFAVKLMF
jgi:hypothetical protein